MSIAGTLNEVLKVRKQSLGKVNKKIENLEKDLEKVNQFLQVREKVEQLSKSKKASLFGSEMEAKKFDVCLEKANNYKKTLELTKRAYGELGVRFERDTVNLCIIGEQGHGKSLLLQSISGLDNKIIPSAVGTSVTGVTSIIKNNPDLAANKPKVRFYMKDEKTVVAEIKQELLQLWKEIGERTEEELGLDKITKLESLKLEIQKNTGTNIETCLRESTLSNGERERITKEIERVKKIYYDKWDEWYPLVYTEEITYDDWARNINENEKYPLLTDKERKEPVFELTNIDCIEKFITKRTKVAGGGDYEYNVYHIAIRKAEIETRFEGIESPICLIDTVGIGDAFIDTKARMELAIDCESDGVIFLYKVDDAMRGFEASKAIDVLAETCKERKSKRPGDWTSLLLNVYGKNDCEDAWIQNYFDRDYDDVAKEFGKNMGEKEKYEEYGTALNKYIKNFQNSKTGIELFNKNSAYSDGVFIQSKDALNVKNKDRVIDYVNHFLEHLSKTLDKCDEARMEDAKKLQEKAENAKEDFTAALQSLMIPSQNIEDLISFRMKRKVSDLKDEFLINYKGDISKESLKAPLDTLYAKLCTLKNDETVEGDISLSRIVDESWDSHKLLEPAKIRAKSILYMKIRQIADFSDSRYKKTELQYKIHIAKLFVDKLGIELDNFSAEKINVTDKDFFKKIGDLIKSTCDYIEDIPKYFYAMQKFQLNDSSVLAESIVNYIAYTHLRKPIGAEIEKTMSDDAKKKDDKANTASDKTKDAIDFSKFSFATHVPTPKDKIKKELKDALTKICNEVEVYKNNDIMQEITMDHRMKAETMSFVMSFDEHYWEPWSRIFKKWYDKGLILKDDMDEYANIKQVGDEVKKYVYEFLEA